MPTGGKERISKDLNCLPLMAPCWASISFAPISGIGCSYPRRASPCRGLLKRPPSYPSASSTPTTHRKSPEGQREQQKCSHKAGFQIERFQESEIKKHQPPHGFSSCFLSGRPLPFPFLGEEPFCPFFTGETSPVRRSSTLITGMGLTQSQGNPLYTVSPPPPPAESLPKSESGITTWSPCKRTWVGLGTQGMVLVSVSPPR